MAEWPLWVAPGRTQVEYIKSPRLHRNRHVAKMPVRPLGDEKQHPAAYFELVVTQRRSPWTDTVSMGRTNRKRHVTGICASA
jgi:hypothetical protein